MKLTLNLEVSAEPVWDTETEADAERVAELAAGLYREPCLRSLRLGSGSSWVKGLGRAPSRIAPHEGARPPDTRSVSEPRCRHARHPADGSRNAASPEVPSDATSASAPTPICLSGSRVLHK